MPYRLFQTSGFPADDIKLMSDVFDEVRTELHLANREDRLRDMIPYEIVECIRRGERDRTKIKACVRKALHLPGEPLHNGLVKFRPEPRILASVCPLCLGQRLW